MTSTFSGEVRALYARLVRRLHSVWAALGVLTTIALVVAAVALAAFGWITYDVFRGTTQALDDSILLAVVPLRTPPLTAVMNALSFIGSGTIAIPFGLAVYLWLRRKRRRAAAFYLWVVLSGWALNGLTKLLMHRARPRVIPRLAHAGWYSFPSGHSMLAPLVFGLAAVLLLRPVRSRWLHAVALTVTTTLVAGISLSRVYLGVHYPSDVVGALLAGTGWAAGWVYLTERMRAGSMPVTTTTAPTETGESKNQAGELRDP
ncbi:MAG: phosphatase PAP2 family protein [Gemmatimonadota bacterium]